MINRSPPVVRQRRPGLWLGTFEAMKSPCEVCVECADENQAHVLVEQAANEAWRIEEKFSRFLPESVIGRINRATGWQPVDEETMALLKLADTCWQATDGLIDITIGAVMCLWRFDGQSPPPPRHVVAEARKSVGWDKVELRTDAVRLKEGVQLDFGGIGKEYAVDRVGMQLLQALPKGGVLVNFGGDVLAARSKKDGQPWHIGVETLVGQEKQSGLALVTGAVATSGDTKRFAVDGKGQRLGHVLNPKTGWPVPHGPATVTVVGGTATQAGLLATCAMLQGKYAGDFLAREGVRHYIQWPK